MPRGTLCGRENGSNVVELPESSSVESRSHRNWSAG